MDVDVDWSFFFFFLWLPVISVIICWMGEFLLL